MSLLVLKPGLLTTVQDQGRIGWQRYGIAVGGAVDAFAARVANLLVGNPAGSAVLELALVGPELRAEREELVAVCGADFGATVGGQPLARDRPARVRAGETLAFGPARGGARAWLAVAGGIEVPVVFGSRSTNVRARLGGHEGRPLIAGDRLPTGAPPAWARRQLAQLAAASRTSPGWSVRPETLGQPPAAGGVRALRGPEWDRFTPEAQAGLFAGDYVVTKDADRMGMRLQGASLPLREPRDEISSGVNVGVVQVPPSGQPIVLLAGRQSVGGYARIAAVAAVDLGRLAQLRAGDRMRFAPIDLAEAHGLLLRRERELRGVCQRLEEI